MSIIYYCIVVAEFTYTVTGRRLWIDRDSTERLEVGDSVTLWQNRTGPSLLTIPQAGWLGSLNQCKWKIQVNWLTISDCHPRRPSFFPLRPMMLTGFLDCQGWLHMKNINLVTRRCFFSFWHKWNAIPSRCFWSPHFILIEGSGVSRSLVSLLAKICNLSISRSVSLESLVGLSMNKL